MLRPGKAPLHPVPEVDQDEDKSKLRRTIKKFDMHPKIKPSAVTYTQKSTTSGIFMSVFLIVAALFVLWEESNLFFQPITEDFMAVDQAFGEQLVINMDISFYKLKCSEISVDAVDYNGEQQIAVEHEIYKISRGENGEDIGNYRMQSELGDFQGITYLPPDYCGSCFGAQLHDRQCCNTCTELKSAYRRYGRAESLAEASPQCQREKKYGDLPNEFGCRIRGTLKVNKMEGNFHVAAGVSHPQAHGDHSHHIHHIDKSAINNYDISHHIHHLSFGEIMYPGQIHPLDNTDYIADGLGSLAYYVKLVPTQYQRISGDVGRTNQFSVYKKYTPVDVTQQHYRLPGVFFKYEIYPMMITYVEQRKSLFEFIIRLFSILGGLYATMNLSLAGFALLTSKRKSAESDAPLAPW